MFNVYFNNTYYYIREVTSDECNFYICDKLVDSFDNRECAIIAVNEYQMKFNDVVIVI
jgi:hypothetical protein